MEIFFVVLYSVSTILVTYFRSSDNNNIRNRVKEIVILQPVCTESGEGRIDPISTLKCLCELLIPSS